MQLVIVHNYTYSYVGKLGVPKVTLADARRIAYLAR